MISHRYLPSAREELNEAAAFYDAAVPGLGEALLDDVERAIETIASPRESARPSDVAFEGSSFDAFPSASSMSTATTKSSSSQSPINVDVRVTGEGDNDRASGYRGRPVLARGWRARRGGTGVVPAAELGR